MATIKAGGQIGRIPMISALMEWLGRRRADRQMSSRALIDTMKHQARKAEAETVMIRKRRAEMFDDVFSPQSTTRDNHAPHTR